MTLLPSSIVFLLFTSSYGQVLPDITKALANLNSDDSVKSIPQPELVQKYGYDIESFDVITNDSYILRVFHIIKSKCKGTKKQPPVILTHGLLQDSDVWFDAGPEAGLGYILADDCHDVWLTNARGNYYGRRHVTLNPDTDPEFWNFTVDEMGSYDVPAFIDFVLNATGSAQVNYIGFSQGCGSFYIMCDEKPMYCKKVQLKISLAPATRHLNTKSIGFKSVTILFNLAKDAIISAGIYEALPIGGLVQTALKTVCHVDVFYDFCQGVLALIDAANPGSIDKTTIKVLFNHFPAGTSVKNMARYGQAQVSKKFYKFDYGPKENIVKYGSAIPPAYNLSATDIPIVVIYGKNDGIVDKADVMWAASHFPNLLEKFKVKDPLWTHFDDTDSYLVPELTLPKIRQYLAKYST